MGRPGTGAATVGTKPRSLIGHSSYGGDDHRQVCRQGARQDGIDRDLFYRGLAEAWFQLSHYMTGSQVGSLQHLRHHRFSWGNDGQAVAPATPVKKPVDFGVIAAEYDTCGIGPVFGGMFFLFSQGFCQRRHNRIHGLKHVFLYIFPYTAFTWNGLRNSAQCRDAL